jgi:hypothetical protein
MIRADVHMREAFQNWCPLGCKMLPELYLLKGEAIESLKLHLRDVHKVSNANWSMFLIDLEGKEVKQ